MSPGSRGVRGRAGLSGRSAAVAARAERQAGRQSQAAKCLRHNAPLRVTPLRGTLESHSLVQRESSDPLGRPWLRSPGAITPDTLYAGTNDEHTAKLALRRRHHQLSALRVRGGRQARAETVQFPHRVPRAGIAALRVPVADASTRRTGQIAVVRVADDLFVAGGARAVDVRARDRRRPLAVTAFTALSAPGGHSRRRAADGAAAAADLQRHRIRRSERPRVPDARAVPPLDDARGRHRVSLPGALLPHALRAAARRTTSIFPRRCSPTSSRIRPGRCGC